MSLRFRGVANIVRFNWHFYAISLVAVLAAVGGALQLSGLAGMTLWLVALTTVFSTLTSLLVSWYVYDLSGMDRFDWLRLPEQPARRVIQLHAGFDESRRALANVVSHADYRVYDFFDPQKHSEVSIRRARIAYPPDPATVAVDSERLPLEPGSVDLVALIFSAHEIRDEAERIRFFRQLAGALAEEGRILVVEHLRDWRNFGAFNFGFLHFLSDHTWGQTFSAADLHLESQERPNFFVTAYMLKR